MHQRKRLVVLCLGIALGLAAAAGGLYAAGRLRRTPRTSDEVARAYMSAVRAGDTTAARSLYHGDPLCSAPPPYPYDRIDAHVAMLSSAEVRAVTIEVQPAQGVSVLPGSETATLSFEYAVDGAWHAGAIWLVLGPPGEDGARRICYLADS